LHEFQSLYPDIRLDLNVSDAVVDPVKVGVDCALQIFPAQSTDVISKPLFPIRRVFCATPHYLEAHGYPTRDRWTFHHQGTQATLYLRAALFAAEALLRGDFVLNPI
jgi:DNA-binding transcriptional LysR family regulator